EIGAVAGNEVNWWVRALANHCRDALDDLKLLVPMLVPNQEPDRIPTLRELAESDNFESREPARRRIAAIERLAVQAAQLADMDYDFLFDKKSRLFEIGYNVSERQPDS